MQRARWPRLHRFDGNGKHSGYEEPQLGSVTLHVGQETRGHVVFDVPEGTSGAVVQVYVGNVLFRCGLYEDPTRRSGFD
jgi:hypothetical protein